MIGDLRLALDRLSAALQVLQDRPPPPQLTRTMVEKLGADGAAPRAPEIAVLEGVRRRLYESLSDGRRDQVDPRDLKRAPWVLWNGNPPAIGFPGLQDMVVDLAVARPRALRHLIEAWLRDFAPEAPGIRAVGAAIRDGLQQHGDLRLQGWREAQREFELFDPVQGPAILALAILSSR